MIDIDVVKVESELKRKEQKIAAGSFLGMFFLAIAIIANCFEKSIINTVIIVFFGAIGIILLFFSIYLLLEIYENKYIKKIKLMYLELTKKDKMIIFFISLGCILIMLGLVIFYFVESFLILGIFFGLGMICLIYALFIDFNSSREYNKELEKELKKLKNKLIKNADFN